MRHREYSTIATLDTWEAAEAQRLALRERGVEGTLDIKTPRSNGQGYQHRGFRLIHGVEAKNLTPTPQFDTIEQWLGRMIPDNDDLGQRAGHVRRRRYKTRGLQRKEMIETGLVGIDKKTHPFEFKHSLVSRDEIAAKFGKLLLAKRLVGKTMPIVWNVDPAARPDFRPLQRALGYYGIALMTVAEFKATL